MLSKNREKYAPFEVRIASVFGKISRNPNFWTVVSLLFSIIAAWMIVQQKFITGAVFLAISAMLDVVDGSVARLYRKATSKGAYTDTIADRYAEAVVIAAFIFVPLPFFIFPSAAWVVLLLFGSLLTTYSKAAAGEKHLPIPLGVLLERAERMFLLFATVVIAYFSKTYMLYAIIVLALLTNLSAMQRIRKVLR